MPNRLPIIEGSTGTAEQRDALLEWSQDRGQTGKPGAIFGMLVASPEGMRRVGKLGAFARMGTGLPALVRETAAFVAVVQRGFEHEIVIHARNLERHGADADLVKSIQQGETTGLPNGVREAASLAWAMARGGEVPPDIFDQAHQALGDQGLVELAITVGYYLMLSDLARVFTPED